MKETIETNKQRNEDGCDANILGFILRQPKRRTSVKDEAAVRDCHGKDAYAYLNAVAEQTTSVQLSKSRRAAMTKEERDKMSGGEERDGPLRRLEGYRTALRRSSLGNDTG